MPTTKCVGLKGGHILEISPAAIAEALVPAQGEDHALCLACGRTVGQHSTERQSLCAFTVLWPSPGLHMKSTPPPLRPRCGTRLPGPRPSSPSNGAEWGGKQLGLILLLWLLATSSVLVTTSKALVSTSDALVPGSFLLLVVWPGAPSSGLAPSSDARRGVDWTGVGYPAGITVFSVTVGAWRSEVSRFTRQRRDIQAAFCSFLCARSGPSGWGEGSVGVIKFCSGLG